VTRWEGDIISYKQNLIATMDDDIEMAQSADNRNQMSLKSATKPKEAPKPKVNISLNYKPSFTPTPAAKSNGNSSNGSGYVPPHKRGGKVTTDDADWFNDD